MRFKSLLIASVAFAASAASASAEFELVESEAAFRAIVDGKTLSRPLIRLQVTSNGEIAGTGATRPVSGSWRWENGYFCRDLAWGEKNLGYNCQEVRVDGAKIRFHADRGKGDFADFRMK